MKTKLSILAFLLLPTLGFSCPGAFYVYSRTAIYIADPSSGLQCLTGWDRQPEQFCTITGGAPDQFGRVNISCDMYYPAASCPAGTQLTDSINKICAPACASGTVYSSNTNLCEPTPVTGLHGLDGDPISCKIAGGNYFKDSKCYTNTEAINKIFNDPTVQTGAFLLMNGIIMTSTGTLLSLPTGGISAFEIGLGLHASLAGIGTIAVGLDGLIVSSSADDTSASATATNPDGSKIKLIQDSSGGGSSIVKSDPTTGKVTDVTQISQATKDAFNAAVAALSASNYADTLKNNPTDQPVAMTSPPVVSLADSKQISIDYTANTATTKTHTAQSTNVNPVTTTSTTPVTVTQNADGTVSTTPSDSATSLNSWTVSGQNGGNITYTQQPVTGTGGTGTGTGTTTGTGPDYSGVLNDIKTNTGESKTTLQAIKDFFTGMFDNSDSVDTSKATGVNADGNDKLDGLGKTVEGSFSGFVFTDPLGLNGVAGGGIPAYTFNFRGHTYTILDQSMIDRLPFSLLRSLFLFLAALAGIITVVSGV